MRKKTARWLAAALACVAFSGVTRQALIKHWIAERVDRAA